MTAIASSPASKALVIVFAVAVATIAGAWAFELIGGLAPCPLCLKQRWAWYAAIALSAVLFMAARGGPGGTFVRAGLWLIVLIMIASAIFGVYHSGVEWKWWAGPTTCAAGGGLSGGLPNFATAKVVRCDEAAIRIFGLSLAGYNALLSLVMAWIAAWGARVALERQI